VKTFEIITESDARVLERGETVMLAQGGHITPLAADTLKERRVTVVREGQAPDAAAALERTAKQDAATRTARRAQVEAELQALRAIDDRLTRLATAGS